MFPRFWIPRLCIFFQAFLSFLGSIVKIFTGFLIPDFDKASAIFNTVTGTLDLAENINKLLVVLKTCDVILDILDAIDIDDIGAMANELSTNYKEAINNGKELAMMGGRFDEIKNLANSRIAAVDLLTKGGIADATAKMKLAMFNLCDSGKRLITASSKFVDEVIQLTIVLNELTMAENDLERAEEEVSRIIWALEDFKQEKEDFWNQREKDRKNYEDEIDSMKEEYDQMTEERRKEFKRKITALYDNYRESFNAGLKSYQSSIGLIIQSIHNKWIGLKDASMSQRSMLLSLFLDYCDAK